MLKWPAEPDVLYTVVLSNIDINSRRNRYNSYRLRSVNDKAGFLYMKTYPQYTVQYEYILEIIYAKILQNINSWPGWVKTVKNREFRDTVSVAESPTPL